MSSRRGAILPGPAKFIGLCRWISLPVLVIVALAGTIYRLSQGVQFYHPSAVGVTTPADLPADFPQFYMGGVIARYGIWDDMYPIPKPGSVNNPGEPFDSDSRPRYKQLAQQTGVNEAFRYILSPPATLLLCPISLLPYRTAAWTWIGVNLGCAWGAAWLAGAFYGKLVGRRTYIEGLIVLLVALSPDTRRSTNPGNLSPMIALLIGLSIWSLLHEEDRRAGMWIVIGAILKYVTAVFIPLAIAMRRWRTIAWVAGISIATLVISVALMRTGPFLTYLQIFPTLNRPFIGPYRFNQTFYGLGWEYFHQSPLPAPVVRLIHIAQLAVLALVLVLIFRRKRTDWQDPATVIGAAAALLMWLMLFSPVVWIHYVLYVSIFFGWVLWEALRKDAGWPVRLAAIIAALFLWVPYTGGEGFGSLHEQPMSFHVFYAELTIFAIAVCRLTLPARATALAPLAIVATESRESSSLFSTQNSVAV